MDFLIGTILGITFLTIIFKMNQWIGLPIPVFENKKYHIHHSFYGLIVAISGIITRNSFLLGLGLGFIIHHEYTEPNLKGFSKFISVNKKHARR